MVRRKSTRSSGSRCNCRTGIGILGIIFLAAGFYFVVGGFISQTSDTTYFWNWNAMLYYLVGIALFGLGKMFKHEAHCNCKIHGMK